MIRGLVATTVVGGVVTAAVLTGHHPKTRPAHTGSASLAPVAPLFRASRAEPRPPLRVVAAHPKRAKGTPRRQSGTGRAVPATRGGVYSVTAYCPTGNRNAAGHWPHVGEVAVLDRSIRFGTRVLIAGNVYTVADWVGSGTDFDVYMDGPNCEQRALAFGRRHLRVVIER